LKHSPDARGPVTGPVLLDHVASTDPVTKEHGHHLKPGREVGYDILLLQLGKEGNISCVGDKGQSFSEKEQSEYVAVTLPIEI
jgi:hypothetical protein